MTIVPQRPDGDDVRCCFAQQWLTTQDDGRAT